MGDVLPFQKRADPVQDALRGAIAVGNIKQHVEFVRAEMEAKHAEMEAMWAAIDDRLKFLEREEERLRELRNEVTALLKQLPESMLAVIRSGIRENRNGD